MLYALDRHHIDPRLGKISTLNCRTWLLRHMNLLHCRRKHLSILLTLCNQKGRKSLIQLSSSTTHKLSLVFLHSGLISMLGLMSSVIQFYSTITVNMNNTKNFGGITKISPTYLKQFKIRYSKMGGCGEIGYRLHYATSCP